MIGWLVNLAVGLLSILLVVISIKIYLYFTKVLCTCNTKLDGKVVIVTGGNAGIGFETAKRLARHGARVVIASRNVQKSRAAAEKISQDTGNSSIDSKYLDLSSLSSVKKFVDDFNKSYDRLDVLINNAGFSQMAQEYTEDGIEKVLQVNHVAPAYLTHLLLDKMIATKKGRIIFVASELYRIHNFDPNDIFGKTKNNLWVRYANSKFCNIMSAKALAKKLPEGVTANALHPGTTDSDIWENVPYKIVKKILYALLKLMCKTCEECAQTTIHAALSPSLENVTGQYFDECRQIKVRGKWSEDLALKIWDDTVKQAQLVVSRKTD